MPDTRLVTQQHPDGSPDYSPTRKVNAASAASAFAFLAVSLLNRLAEAGITVEEAGFIVTLCVFLAGYIVRERDTPGVRGT